MTRSELRQRAEAMIEELVSILDTIDGDPDAETETDLHINPVSLQVAEIRPAKRVTLRRAA